MTARVNADSRSAESQVREINVPAPAPRFEFNADAAGENTRIDYRLSDPKSGLTVKGSVVLAGRVSEDDVLELRDTLGSGREFDPFRDGIPDLVEKMPASWKDVGSSFHVIERISFTNNAAADYLPTAYQFVSALSEDYGSYLSTGSI